MTSRSCAVRPSGTCTCVVMGNCRCGEAHAQWVHVVGGLCCQQTPAAADRLPRCSAKERDRPSRSRSAAVGSQLACTPRNTTAEAASLAQRSTHWSAASKQTHRVLLILWLFQGASGDRCRHCCCCRCHRRGCRDRRGCCRRACLLPACCCCLALLLLGLLKVLNLCCKAAAAGQSART